jgi:hypothetical protein
MNRNSNPYRAELREDGTAIFPGVEFNNGSQPIVIWQETKTHIVFKIPGGKHWSGHGMQSSYGAKFLVAELPAEPGWTDEDGTRHLTVNKLFDMPVSKRGRRAS